MDTSPITSIRRDGPTSFIIEREAGGVTYTDFGTTNPATLRARAAELRERAERLLRCAGDACAIALQEEVRQAESAEWARTERNAKVAATRARRADPFGFKAMGFDTETG